MGLNKNKFMTKALVAGLLMATGTGAQAQAVDYFANSWNNTGTTGTWNDGNNWFLVSGFQGTPDGEGFSEFAVINNGGLATVNSAVVTSPLALYIGERTGDSGSLNIAGGSLSVLDFGVLPDAFVAGAADTNVRPASPGTAGTVGMIVVGLGGDGDLNVSGGTLTTSRGIIVSGNIDGGTTTGGVGTFGLSGTGIVNTSGTTVIGAGGGEAAVWTMTGGIYNQLVGEVDIGGNTGGVGRLNMSGGQINTISGDLDIGGNGGGSGIVNMSNNAKVVITDVNQTVGVFVGVDTGSHARLTMSNTASIESAFLASQQSTDSVTTLEDQSVLTLTDGLYITSGKLRVEGHEVGMNVNNLTLSGTYNPTINSNGPSVIHASGDVILGGTLNLELDDVTPTLSSSWSLVDGTSTITGNFAQVISNKELDAGTQFAARVSAGNVDVIVEKALTLKVNTVSGTSSIIDVLGGVDIVSYSIHSKSGLLNTDGWNSLEDGASAGWKEANPLSSQVSELNLEQSFAMTTGGIHNLGQLIGNIDATAAFGQAVDTDEFKLVYLTSDGVEHNGILDVSSMNNNLVLTVDPTTGMAVLRNESLHDIELVSYSVVSVDGSLDGAGGDSLADQGITGWDELVHTSNLLGGLNLEGMLSLDAGELISLGKVMTAEALADLILQFRLNDEVGTTLDGIVVYGDLPNFVEGDFDLDGDVDADDLAIVRNGFGVSRDLGDLFLVRNGTVSGALVAVGSVPEPTSIFLMGLGLIAGIKRRK